MCFLFFCLFVFCCFFFFFCFLFFFVFAKWRECVKYNHWLHLGFYSPLSYVRRHTDPICPPGETSTVPIILLQNNSPVKFRRHSALVEKYNVSLKTLLQQGISEPEFYGDLVYRFRKIVRKSNFSEQFRKLINRYKRIS